MEPPVGRVAPESHNAGTSFYIRLRRIYFEALYPWCRDPPDVPFTFPEEVDRRNGEMPGRAARVFEQALQSPPEE